MTSASAGRDLDVALDVADDEPAPASVPKPYTANSRRLATHRIALAVGILLTAAIVDFLVMLGWLLRRDVGPIIPFAATITTVAGTVTGFYFAQPHDGT